MHFTYEPRDLADDLRQGDVLRPTPELMSALRDIHPHFADQDNYPLFMVLTQTCDLVKREDLCKSHYITLCAVTPFATALKREVLKEQRSSTLRKHLILNNERRPLVEHAVQRFLNNTHSGYFYLHTTDVIPEPMCAFLADSIAMETPEHYEKCRASRIIGLKTEFQAKVGWLLGEMFARVATEDWETQPDFSDESYKEMIRVILDENFYWLDEINNKKLSRALKNGDVNAGDREAFHRFINELPGKKERILSVIEDALVKYGGIPKGDKLTRVINGISHDSGFRKLIPGMSLDEDDSSPSTALSP